MTNAELALLGLIVEQPLHGYQIEQIIEHRGMRDWTEIGFSSIYYLLKKLEGKGLIQRERQPSPGSGGPDRKIYHTTEAGQKAWYQASLDCLREPDRKAGSILLGLAALPYLPNDEVVQALQQNLDRMRKRELHINTRSAAQQPLPPHVDAMFDYSLKMIQSEMQWIDKLIQDLEAGKIQTNEE